MKAILNAIAFTQYPITTDTGAIVPWFGVKELEALLLDPETTSAHLSKFFVDCCNVRLTESKTRNTVIEVTGNLCSAPVYIVIENRLVSLKLRAYMDSMQSATGINFTVVDHVFKDYDTRFIEPNARPRIDPLVQIFAQNQVSAQVNPSGVITPFSRESANNVKLTFIPHGGILPDDDERCDYLPSNYLYYGPLGLLNIYTIRTGTLPFSVLAPSAVNIIDQAEECKVDLLPITEDSTRHIARKSKQSILPLYTRDVIINGFVTDVMLKDIIRKCGIQYLSLPDGTIYEYSDVFGISANPVKQLDGVFY